MTAIQIRQFMGETPLMNNQLLPDGAATTATNTDLSHGDLRAWNTPSLINTPTKSGTKLTIYRFGESQTTDAQYWLSWTTDVDVVRAPIDGDTSERTYFTGDGAPKKMDNVTALTGGGSNYPIAAYLLGMPKPDTATSNYTVTGSATDPASIAINAAYLVTYVSAWGEEGQPSDPIGVAVFRTGQTNTLTNLPVAPTGNYNITHKRIYRSNTGTGGTNYQFAVELAIAATSWADTMDSADLGEVIQTIGWEAPPTDGFGMTLGANGNCIMLSGKTIFPSIPFILYAYPPEYQQSTESALVGAGAFGQGFAILTKSNPYALYGSDPASYSLVRLDDDKACLSKRSIVEMMGAVVYASSDGLWMIDGTGMKPLTRSLFTRDQWQAFVPTSMHAYELDGRYHCFYDTGTVQGSLIFDFGRVPYVIKSNVTCTAAYNDPLRNALYLSQSTAINKWNGSGTALSYVWESKEYRTPWFVNYGYGKVEAEAYPVTFKYYVDGVLKHTQTVANALPFRLPPVPSRAITVSVTGTAQVNVVAVAETGEEIAKA